VTEGEWRQCTDLLKMLDFLRSRASDRKLRLFACACCRGVWRQLRDGRSRRVVEVAERLADGLATDQEREKADIDPEAAANALGGFGDRWNAAWAVCYCIHADCGIVVSWTLDHLGIVAVFGPEPNGTDLLAPARAAALLRCLFSNPFRPVSLDLAWLTWRDGLVRRLAEVAYEQRQLPSGHLDPDRLVVLADALEEAGCTDPEILGHLRGPGPHTRGCHIVDLILDRK
jgi:hypothetical protein